jgi:glutathione S-transferase
MTSTTETANSGVDQSNANQSLPNQEPVSPVSENETTAEQQTEGSNAETASPKKEPVIKPTVHKLDYEKDIVYLYQFSRCPTIPSASPFCFKVETWLRMNAIPYENVDHKMKFKSKKGQLPFVELNGKEIADSDIIIRELSQYFDKDLDFGLTDEQKNVSHAFESMLNNHTSWVVRWWRYNNPQEFLDSAQLDIKRTLNSRLPNALLNIIFKIGFKRNVQQAIGHGLGRHSPEEIYDFGKSDLKAINEYLADKEYFFGKEPHLLDCVAFAHLTQFLYIPFAGMKEWMETETPKLVAFVDRIKNRYWSDWDQICSTLELNTHLPKKEISPEKEEEAKKEEAKKEEERKKKEEKKKAQEEKKKEREEKKKREKEEKERKKKEKEEKEKAEKEKREREKAEAEKEKAEKEKAEKEKAEKEKAEKENAVEKTDEAKGKTADEKTSESVPETKDTKTEDSTKAAESAEKKE